MEALLFTDTDVLGAFLTARSASISLRDAFRKIKDQFDQQCESIDDGLETAPSKRIEALAFYRKGESDKSQASPILQQIGLSAIHRACPRFHDWVSKLERLKA